MLNALRSGSSSRNSPNPATPALCIKCQSQPQAQDPRTGRNYLYCSNECAAPRTLPGLPIGFNVGNSQGTSAEADPQSNPFLLPCDHCKRRPRRIEGTVIHPYCGRTCADLAIASNNSNTGRASRNRGASANSRDSVGVLTNMIGSLRAGSSAYQYASPARICVIPECPSPVYVDPMSGIASDYCTRTHRWRQHGCISCRRAPTDGVSVFCQSCHANLLREAPMIVEVPEDHVRYKSIASQFQRKWLHDTPCPEVRMIYKVVSSAKTLKKYEEYRDRVEAKGQFVSQGRSYGNENRRWHGTVRECTIGDEGETELCSDPSCSLCCIMKTTFDLAVSAKKTNFRRFGMGIYTSSTSSKTDQYSRNGSGNSTWKAMLLNRVVVGGGYKLTADSTALTKPPAGCDSVLGEVGDSLNYDETVVYTNDAIRPSYLVMYDTP